MDREAKILVTGAGGMVGRSLTKALREKGFINLLTPSSDGLDLRKEESVESYFEENRPEYVFHLASKVGGIAANIAAPAEFLYDNLMIASNVMEAARKNNVKKLVNLGSSCIYPKECKQPMEESDLLTGKLEPTNEGYAIGKIAALKLCEYYNKQYGTNFISIMPPNLYGVGDHFDLKRSHVISALLMKFDKAKDEGSEFVDIWGTGIARREFLYVEDVVGAMFHFMFNCTAEEMGSFVNTGSGSDISIKELAELIKDIVGCNAGLRFDDSKSDGMLLKLLDSSKAERLGWKSKTSLREGLEKTYAWYKENVK